MDDLRKQFLASIRYLSPADQAVVKSAVESATKWHDGQRRDSGEPFINHPVAVASYLARLEAERDTLVASLLHDVVEDNRADHETVKKMFGEDVTKLVDGVTKLTKLHYEGERSFRQVASLRKMLLVASEDLRVIIIKLADRWHNIETISSLRPDKQLRVAHETLDIYVPFARIVGLWDLKRRFEEICFPIAFPEESKEWHTAIKEMREKLREERENFVHTLDSVTAKEVHPQLVPMTDYELYQRVFGDISRISETNNIDSVLVVVKGSTNPSDCYQVLGEIHVRHPVRALSFRDYINAPMPNGYKGLHTTIFLSRNHELRLRIQTQEMYEYVQKRKISSWITEKNSDIYTALSSLHKSAFNKDSYLTDLKGTVLERMNVFTTAGEIIALPRGATGLDYAFSVNPDFLFSLAGVRVNGELREATYELHDGDTIELVLLENGQKAGKAMWVEKVKSVEARESLKQSLSTLPKERQMEEGKSLLEYEGRKRKLPLWWLFHWAPVQQQLASRVGEATYGNLLGKIGTGEVSVATVIDAYKSILGGSPSWSQTILRALRLLPRSRVLNKEASVIDIEVYAEDRQGLIYDISKCIAERKINIAKFAVYAVPPKDALYRVRLEVKDFKEFSTLFDALLQVPNVKTIIRKK